MGFVDPQTIHTPTTGQIAPASWGTVVRDDLVFLSSPPRGVISKAAAENHTSSGSWVSCAADTEAKDTDLCHSTVTNNSRITIVTPGDYLLSGVVEWDTNTVGVRSIRVYKNATTAYLGELLSATSAAAHRTGVTALVTDLVAGDYLEFQGYQNSTGTRAMQLIRGAWLWVGT